MTARKFLDIVKIKVDIRTDKELAEAMGVKYTNITSALARNSIQYEQIIKFLLQRGIDLNEVFSVLLLEETEVDLKTLIENKPTLPDQFSSIDDAIEAEAENIAAEIKSSYIELADHCTIKELKSFKENLVEIIQRVKEKTTQ